MKRKNMNNNNNTVKLWVFGIIIGLSVIAYFAPEPVAEPLTTEQRFEMLENNINY